MTLEPVPTEPAARAELLSRVDVFRIRLKGRVTGDSTTLIRAARDGRYLVV